MIKEYTQEEFENAHEVLSTCEDIYNEKYFKSDFDLEGYSCLTFFTYELNNETIGFGSYQDNDYMFIIELIFKLKYQYSEYQDELFNHIMNEINKKNKDNVNIFVHQSTDEDYKYYLSRNFKLWKDYKEQTPSMFENIEGVDVMRYVLVYKNEKL